MLARLLSDMARDFIQGLCYKTFKYLVCFLLFLLIGDNCSVYSLLPGDVGVCRRVTSSLETYQAMRVQAHRAQYTQQCGFKTCLYYKMIFAPVYYIDQRTVIKERISCCPGFASKDNITCQQFIVLGGGTGNTPQRPTGNQPGAQPAPVPGSPSNPSGPNVPRRPNGPFNPNVPINPDGPSVPSGRGPSGGQGPNTGPTHRDTPSQPGSGPSGGQGPNTGPTHPDTPSQPGSPNNPGSPSQPGNPSNPTDPFHPGKPSGPRVPNQRPGSGRDTPVQPGNPNNPGSPSQPSNPSNPTDPFRPGNPSGPQVPNQRPGSGRDTPVQPGNPNNPGSPSQPGNPSNPTDPFRPGNPSGPRVPNQRPGSGGPNNPINPDGPVMPSWPGKPNLGGGGGVPGTQDRPSQPRNPGEPLNPNASGNPDTDSHTGGARPGFHPGLIPDDGSDDTEEPDKDTSIEGKGDDIVGTPAESRGLSVTLIFGIILAVMFVFALGAIGLMWLNRRANGHEELDDDQPRISYIGSDKDDLLPSMSRDTQRRTALDGGRERYGSKASTSTDLTDTDSGIVRISITEDAIPDAELMNIQWKSHEPRKTLVSKKLRIDLTSKFASILGPYSFTDLRSIHEDTTPAPSQLSSKIPGRCLCNLPPNICPRPHSPVRKTGNFFSRGDEDMNDGGPHDLMPYAYTAVDMDVGIPLADILQRKRNSLPTLTEDVSHVRKMANFFSRGDEHMNGSGSHELIPYAYTAVDTNIGKPLADVLQRKRISLPALTEDISQHGYRQLAHYDEFNDSRKACPQIGYDKLDRGDSGNARPLVKPKPVKRSITKSGSVTELSSLGYHYLSRGPGQDIHKCPSDETYYRQLGDDQRCFARPIPLVKPKPVFSGRPLGTAGNTPLK